MKRSNAVSRLATVTTKLRRSVLLAMAVGAVVFGVTTIQAEAGVKHKNFAVSCIDSIDPEVACFGATVLVPPSPTDPFYACHVLQNQSYLACINQEMASLNQCSRLTDDVDFANCYDMAESTVVACLTDTENMCPPR